MKYYLIFFTLIFSSIGYGQLKNYQKAEKAYLSKNYFGANKTIDKCLENPETKNNKDVFLLKSKIAFEISKNSSNSDKYPKAYKDAINFAQKALNGFSNDYEKKEYVAKHQDFFNQIIAKNKKESFDAYYQKRYGKALPLLKDNIFFNNDTQSYLFVGDCYWQMDQKIEGIPYFKIASELIYTAYSDSTMRTMGYFKEPFKKLGEYYFKKQLYDSAYLYVKKGREISPQDPFLSDLTYALTKYNLNKILPSEDYMVAVESGLRDFPSDSFLNHKQNSIYIFMLNGLAKSNEQRAFDSILLKFSDAKIAKKRLKTLALIKNYDIFAGMSKEEFIPALSNYFATYNLRDACYSTFVSSHFPRPNQTNSKIHLVNLTQEKPAIAEIVFLKMIELNPKITSNNSERNNYTKTENKKPQPYYQLLPMIILNDQGLKSSSKDLDFRQKGIDFRLQLINEASDSADFKLARRIYYEYKKLSNLNSKQLEPLWKTILEKDFKVNYFGSRISIKGKNDPNAVEFNWNGVLDSCKPGKMSPQINLLLENRLNYFRRNAGLTEDIVFAKQDNLFAEIGAMMCEANKSLSHVPNDGWRCYIPAGVDALKDAILIKELNPAIAITAAMGQNHPTVGNRRWLLYPKSQFLGIGASKNYTIIKAIDHSRELDTNKYKNQFIAWPPENGVSKMLLFRKWSFSINQNLKEATVKMADNEGNDIELKQEIIENGYGLNTIVWEPIIKLDNYLDKEITILITLENKKTYSYKTKIYDYKI